MRALTSHTYPHTSPHQVAKALSLALAHHLLAQGPGVAVDMGEASLRYSLDLLGLAHLGYDFQVEREGGGGRRGGYI